MAQVPLFEDLNQDEMRTLIDAQEITYLEPDTYLFKEGDHGDEFFVVIDGQILITKTSDPGMERVMAKRGPGEFIGEGSLLNPLATRSASASAAVQTSLVKFSRASFNSMLRQHPELASKMLAVIEGRLRAAENLTIRDLSEKNQQLRLAYAELKAAQEKIIERETLLRELQRAREIQQSMLPVVLPDGPGYCLGAAMKPAMAVGGDFYDAFVLPNGRIGMAVGDVSGKGIGAALMMALTGSLLRAEAMRCSSPGETLEKVNDLLLSRPVGSMFVTVFFGILEPKSGHFAYARAGHELPVLSDGDGTVESLVRGPGQPLGLFRGAIFDTQEMVLAPGSTLVVFSDGVTEAVGPDYDLFGTERLIEFLMDHGALSSQAICDRLVDVLDEHHGEIPQSDDITILTLETSYVA